MRAMTAALAFAAALAACSNPDAAVARRLPDARLHTLAGTVGPSLSTCPTEKCLTIVVAPWCGICHMAAPDILRLRRFLDTTGVASRVVVGLAEIGPIREFAAEFGPDSLLDPEGAFHPRGVPLFLVSDSNGKVLRVINGFPKTASASALADALGLL